MAFQGVLVVQFDGGGEKKGMVGIVVGMVGIEGIVVGMVGNGMAGRGGRVSLGSAGKVGNGMLGSGGNVALGRVGIEGKGGKDGIVGSVNAGGGAATGVSIRWRAAMLISMLDNDIVITKDNRKK
ncbi:uncharacterized protein LOC132185934 [Corylus avellana]|uniref:uncharacterized protein LOC132185934 n=1 Tax=Corylus avellana TaxID=13451 RepID=UPI00286C8CCC|nr:uncharacterized protein LOC132185934 [Corylus avellana]